jgi:ferredoxin--NADP+ reductase
VYVAGWIKRGPSGVIGTNKGDASATVQKMIEDIRGKSGPAHADPPGDKKVDRLLRERGIRVVDYGAWKRLDRLELERGAKAGKVRDKFTSVADMLAALDR